MDPAISIRTLRLCWHDCCLSDRTAAQTTSCIRHRWNRHSTRAISSNDACVLARARKHLRLSLFSCQRLAPHLVQVQVIAGLFPRSASPGAAPSCAEAGVLGVLPGIIGLVQATEALKLIVGEGDLLLGRLLLFDALKMKFREFKLRRDPECPVCGENPTIFAPIDT